MWSCHRGDRTYRHLSCLWLYGEQRDAGQRNSCGRSRRAVLVAELILGDHCGYRRAILGLHIRIYEYGLPVWWRGHVVPNAVYRATVRLDGIVSGRGSSVLGWLFVLAAGKSRPSGDAKRVAITPAFALQSFSSPLTPENRWRRPPPIVFVSCSFCSAYLRVPYSTDNNGVVLPLVHR